MTVENCFQMSVCLALFCFCQVNSCFNFLLNFVHWLNFQNKPNLTVQQQYSGRMWRLNDAQLVLRGPKCAKIYIPPHHLHHHQQSELLRHGRMDPCFHVLYTKFWPYNLNGAAEIETHQTRQCFSNLLLSNFSEPVWIVASLYCS